SVDPILDPTNPQSINGYAYSGNTPVTSSDPTGLMQMCGEGGAACYPDDWNTDGTANTDGNRATTNDKPKPKTTYVSKPKPKKHHHLWDKALDWAADHVVEIAITVVVVSVVVGCIAATAGACAGVLVAAADGFATGAEFGMTTAVVGAAVSAGAEAITVTGAGAAVVAGAAKAAKAAKGGAGKAAGEGEAGAAAASSEGGGLAAGRQEAPASSGGCNSFPAPTTVLLASGAAIPIDQVKVGDTVQATDPLTNTTKPDKVTHVEVTLTDKDFTDTTVHTPTGDQTITSTQHHPYWDASRKQWVDAAELKLGERLRQSDGAVIRVVGVRSYHRAVTTYNLTVEHIHTYYVLAGATPVLVHNCNVDPQSAPGGKNGAAVSIKQVKMALGRADMSVSQYDIVHVPEIRTAGDGLPAYGNSPHDGNGMPNLGPRGRPVIQISNMGLADMDTAVATIFHEIHHHRMYATWPGSMGGTESAAEEFGQAMLGVFSRRTGS
ncbi:sugar-binding protein, partial [Streptomyces sp. SDr-06]|uniref:polymorphic toxin-type HINT domain-containing protein n=1 Tax=Streptomyces sp. SDr-06 TaxID=2267702 RepID=UPI000E1936B1